MKTKFKIWIGILILGVAFILDNISLTFPKMPHKEEIPLYVDLDENYIKSKVENWESSYDTNIMGGYKMSFTTRKENADIILTTKDVEKLSGYSKFETTYSPMILITWYNDYEDNEMFVRQEIEKANCEYVVVDFKKILNAIENNKTWVDLECFVNDKNIANEKVTLTVANLDTKEGLYAWNTIYQELKEMYPSLNQIDLEKRTNNIFNKCNKSDNILLELKNMTEDDMNNFYLVPEYIVSNGINISQISNLSYLTPIYFKENKVINFHLFLRDALKDKEDIYEKVSLLLMKSLAIRTNDNFPYKYGYDFYNMKRIIDFTSINENLIIPTYENDLTTKVDIITQNQNVKTNLSSESTKEETTINEKNNEEINVEQNDMEQTVSENSVENELNKAVDTFAIAMFIVLVLLGLFLMIGIFMS